jgi:hypothetical protein
MPIFSRDEASASPSAKVPVGRFHISTGGISEPYETVNIVFARVGVPAPAFGGIDKDKALRQAIDALAAQAQGMGCNGVIWIRFENVVDTHLLFSVFASGTAVKVAG